MPWWTFDAGGFFRPTDSQYTDPQYHERFLRWFQFATFSPLQRVHGYQSETEFWRFGKTVEQEAIRYLNLRYRLMPYIYSQAANITFHNGTLMRPLVMDFPDDPKALAQRYEYMFGPSFLVAPVLQEGVDSWEVYLPDNQSAWVDFWTGKSYAPGTTVDKNVTISTIPLFVKAGAIVPMGKFMQYTEEKPQDTLEVRIYPGADGKFDLYEDEGTNYDYEQGAYAVIPFIWNEQAQQLTIGVRQGDFEGMLKNRVFHIVFVAEQHGDGIDLAAADRSVSYTGEQLVINMNRPE